MHDLAFTCMGCEMRLLADGPDDAAVGAARELLDALDARLSRFRPESELARLNADPRETVPASPLLRVAVAAAVWAAERTGGLVDPTLLGDLLAAGYTESLGAGPRAPLAEALAGASLAEALAGAPPRRAARPRADARWRAVRIDDAAGTIARPSGLLLDTGGTTKGLAADAAARLLGDARRLVVDCGGDLRLAVGPGAPAFDVAVEHPLGGDRAATLRLRGGGVATSGLGRRIWRGPDGRPAHHVLDPSTGAPAWTGLVAATAVAPTTLAAEALAKAALLSGAAGARRLLARRGGVLVHDDGTVERVGPRRVVAADERPRRAGAPVRVVAADERPRRAGAPVRVVAADERPRRAGAPVRVVAADERPLGALARLRIAAVPARPTGAAA
jgi:thiamine biosynthesis lipoprotein